VGAQDLQIADPHTRSGVDPRAVSPKDKHQLAREHLQAAQSAVGEECPDDAINALFYAGEAAVLAAADQNGVDCPQATHGDQRSRLPRDR
jgi:hypothetical protein